MFSLFLWDDGDTSTFKVITYSQVVINKLTTVKHVCWGHYRFGIEVRFDFLLQELEYEEQRQEGEKGGY